MIAEITKIFVDCAFFASFVGIYRIMQFASWSSRAISLSLRLPLPLPTTKTNNPKETFWIMAVFALRRHRRLTISKICIAESSRIAVHVFVYASSLIIVHYFEFENDKMCALDPYHYMYFYLSWLNSGFIWTEIAANWSFFGILHSCMASDQPMTYYIQFGRFCTSSKARHRVRGGWRERQHNHDNHSHVQFGIGLYAKVPQVLFPELMYATNN